MVRISENWHSLKFLGGLHGNNLLQISDPTYVGTILIP